MFKNEDEYRNKEVERMDKWMPENVPIFVFGSNLAGRHGKGAALWALKHRGAIYGQGEGLQGKSYAIPTKSKTLKSLPLNQINDAVKTFILFAKNRTELKFQLTPIGCGLAGYRYEDIAPMFKEAPPNVELPIEFKNILDSIQ